MDTFGKWGGACPPLGSAATEHVTGGYDRLKSLNKQKNNLIR